MEISKVFLKAIPSIPNLKAAEFVSSSGNKLVVFSSDPNSFHIALADGSLESFGGITVVGPGVSAQTIDPTIWLDGWLRLKGLKFGSGGWGPVGTTCKMHVTFGTTNGQEINSIRGSWICQAILG